MVSSTKTIVSNAPFNDEIPSLLQLHLAHLKESGISTEAIKQRSYESVLGHERLKDLGFGRQQIHTPGILVPLWGVDGTGIVGYQYRPDSPRLNSKGKPIKYENPRGVSVRLDTPPTYRKLLGNLDAPIWFVEGVKKADSLASRGECAVTLTGVWNFKGRNSLGGTTILADFDYIALKERECYICFDSDYRDNASVSKAAVRLAEHLSRKGAQVRIVYFPPGEHGEKVGVDDFLVQGHSIDDLKALAAPVERKEDENREDEVLASHFERNGLWLEVQKLDGNYAFAQLNSSDTVALVSEAVLDNLRLRPRRLPEVDRQPLPIVGLPDESIQEARLLKPEELYDKVKSHTKRYVDLAELDLDLCTMYVLFTWFYRKVNTVAYLRFLADTGKGKTRGKKVIGDLCFYPLYASGASSFSGIARTQQQWRGTLGTPIKLGEKISEHIGKADVVIIDCITMLISNLLTGQGDDGANEKRMRTEIDRLIECIDRMDATFIIISNEVGMGLVPDNRLGRLYRDLLGRANQLLAQRADEVYLIVVGIPVEIKVH